MSTQPQVATSDVDLSTIPADTLALVEAKLRTRMEETNAVELARFKDDLRQSNDITIQKALKDWEDEERKRRAPLTPEQIKIMLDKEYLKFDIKLEDQEGKIKSFVIRELPQTIEREFYQIAKDTIKNLLNEVSGISFKDLTGDVFEKIVNLMEMFEPIHDVLAECCVICLNPKKKSDGVDVEWVKNNMTNYRIASVLTAQFEANKLRDFFSILFQGFQSGGPKNPADVQQ